MTAATTTHPFTQRARGRLVCAGAAIALVTLAGCGAAGSASSQDGGSGRTASDSFATADTAKGGVPAPAAPAEGATTPSSVLVGVNVDDRSIIRNGAVRLRADQVQTAALAAAAAARDLGGLVSSENTVTDPTNPDRTVAEITLRVPADRFDSLLVKVRGLGVVLEQTQQAEDVTGQVADVDARVKAQRASVARIQALLARANTIGEVVTVEAQLAQRQSDLEALEAQQKALADQTSLATLQVSVVGPDPAGTSDDPTGFMAGLRSGWDAFTSAMTTGLTAFGALIPFLGLALVIGLPLAAWIRSRSRRPEVAAPPAGPYEPVVREDQPVG